MHDKHINLKSVLKLGMGAYPSIWVAESKFTDILGYTMRPCYRKTTHTFPTHMCACVCLCLHMLVCGTEDKAHICFHSCVCLCVCAYICWYVGQRTTIECCSLRGLSLVL